MSGNFTRSVFVCGLSLAAGLWSAQAQAGAISNYRVLHTFCQATSCADGALAIGAPAMDANGDLFGVTAFGGRFGGGALYELVPKHGGARYFKHVLKAFCDPDYCSGSGEPEATPIMDGSGNLYGTTTGVKKSCGAVYMKSAEPQLHVLHIFQGADGCHPTSGSLVYQGSASGQAYDGISPLYGLTSDGGANSEGAVYELTPPQPGSNKWGARTIYSFCHISDCADGVNPQGNLVMDASGDLLGGTSDGLIFELSPDGSGGFDYQGIYVSRTGETYVGFALASDGATLYGIASSGGGSPAGGTLFSLAAGCRACGARQIIYTPLHTFCSGGGNCVDGNSPNAIVLELARRRLRHHRERRRQPGTSQRPHQRRRHGLRIHPCRIVPHALQFLRPGELRGRRQPARRVGAEQRRAVRHHVLRRLYREHRHRRRRRVRADAAVALTGRELFLFFPTSPLWGGRNLVA